MCEVSDHSQRYRPQGDTRPVRVVTEDDYGSLTGPAPNGREEKVEAKPGTYLTLRRDWKDGDTIALRLPFSFRLEPVMDMPNLAGIFYGPVLLAVQEEAPLSAWRAVTLDAADISRSISGDPAALRFTIGELALKPFFESYGNYSVYLDVTLK